SVVCGNRFAWAVRIHQPPNPDQPGVLWKNMGLCGDNSLVVLRDFSPWRVSHAEQCDSDVAGVPLGDSDLCAHVAGSHSRRAPRAGGHGGSAHGARPDHEPSGKLYFLGGLDTVPFFVELYGFGT